jgi:hypothetical protein
MMVTKSSDYHNKIGKTIISISSPDELVWRRIIKLGVVSGKFDKVRHPESGIEMDEEVDSHLDIHIPLEKISFKSKLPPIKPTPVNPFVHEPVQPSENIVRPEDSMSGIFEREEGLTHLGEDAQKSLRRLAIVTDTIAQKVSSEVPKKYGFVLDDPNGIYEKQKAKTLFMEQTIKENQSASRSISMKNPPTAVSTMGTLNVSRGPRMNTILRPDRLNADTLSVNKSEE